MLPQALEKLESKPPKQPAAAFDSASEVSDVELSDSEGSEVEERTLAGAASSTPRRRLRRLQHAGDDAPMPDASLEALAAFGVKLEAAAVGPAALQPPALTAQQAAAVRAASASVEEWEVWEPAAEDSGEEWGGRRGRGGRGRGRGRRRKEREAEREAQRRAARRQALPPRQRLALRALASAVSGISAESTVAEVLAQAQRQASAAHASLAPAVPESLLVPAGSSDAPPLGSALLAAAATSGAAPAAAGKAAGGSKAAAAASGPIAALLTARQPDLSAFKVPSAAPAFEELTDLPQYRRNLESHCRWVGVVPGWLPAGLWLDSWQAA